MDSTVLILESSRLWLRRHQQKRHDLHRSTGQHTSNPDLVSVEKKDLHDGEHLREDNARFSQVLVQNPLVEVIGGVFDLRGLEQ